MGHAFWGSDPSGFCNCDDCNAPDPYEEDGEDEVSTLAHRIEMVLNEHGLRTFPKREGEEIHIYTCRYVSVYGPCTCLQDLIDALVNAASEEAGQST